MKLFTLALAALAASLALPSAPAAQVFNQPHDGSGAVHKSSWYAPDGLDGDEYAWDSFTLASSAAITEIRWRGGYAYGAGQAPVYDFDISIYRSIGAGTQPDLGAGGRLVHYTAGGNCNETSVGTFGGTPVYDYRFTLPVVFQAAAGTKYWVQIEASQGVRPLIYWPPDWGLCNATGGDNHYFRFIVGGQYQNITGDCAFSLYGSNTSTVNIAASVDPPGAGTVSGAGAYPVNSTAQLIAAANAGWGFVNWTENGNQVSTNATYTFTATVNRTLVAHFVPAYTITTAAYPPWAGTTTGDGVYNEGSTVTVTATPKHGWQFSEWQGWSTSPVYSFPATSDMVLPAMFAPAPLAATFDFDNGPVSVSLPLSYTVDGLTATLSATGSGFSVQSLGSIQIHPAGFYGICLYPNSVFAADLLVSFSQPLTDFSILYSPQELGCDNSATMRVTAYMNGSFVATATATVPQPGTWPTGTLSIAVPAPATFNSVVVHYDARPPTCQDWGPIFLADIITVTRACVPAGVAQDPAPATACLGGTAVFTVVGSGSGPFTYQWRKEGVPIDTGLNPSAATDTLVLSWLYGPDTGTYDCVVTGHCGSATSGAASLSLLPDLNIDGAINTADLVILLGQFGQSVGPWNLGDLNGDGLVNTADLTRLLGSFGVMCP